MRWSGNAGMVGAIPASADRGECVAMEEGSAGVCVCLGWGEASRGAADQHRLRPRGKTAHFCGCGWGWEMRYNKGRRRDLVFAQRLDVGLGVGVEKASTCGKAMDRDFARHDRRG